MKTGGRKPLGVRVPLPPLLLDRQFATARIESYLGAVTLPVTIASGILTLFVSVVPLAAQCPDGSPPPSVTSAGRTVSPRTWIVVPFTNVTGDPQTDWLRDPVEPMLSQLADKPPESDDYVYEVKWDGLRALISLDEGVTPWLSRPS